ncbi:PP2C family serine/threonine-protein phosphatase [Chryseobacterium sp. Mn2064]|uniref:PP2C family serine/threonine-protein phosphatase n=1 Tax=Chryseobacterium sp. Mn2064 TaxID=3395263 RepID=UPI003BDB11BD
MKIPSFYFGSSKKAMEKNVVTQEKEEFKEAHWVLKNAVSNKPYQFSFDMENFPNIIIKSIGNLEETGLVLKDNTISGIPSANTIYHLDIEFYHIADPEHIEIKKVDLFVNADPKDLWKNIPTDPNTDFYKIDEASYKGSFLDKKIVVASKRGRSHAHEGKFREDDFAVNELSSGWNIISVSDGAGSAQFAREGSRLATISVNKFFSSKELLDEIEHEVCIYYASEFSQDLRTESGQNIIKHLYKAVVHTYSMLEKTAEENNFVINELNATLIFALAKKFSFGYVILTFGVGDCPINLINSDFSEVKLLNQMDVGEFSGGTRFITMKEIYNESAVHRFKITRVEDFSHLVLMTDGIYDPKFVTENKLENGESWKTFFSDLSGNNDDGTKVDFTNDTTIDEQLMMWTDFWSRGNHDDRTLAIIY